MFFRFRPRKGRFRDLNIIYEIFGKNFGQNFVKKGQNWWKSTFSPNIFYLMVKTPGKHSACKIWAFYHFSLPPKWTFLSCVFTKIKKIRPKLGQKGVKTGEKGRWGPKLLNTWLENPEKMMHAKFQLLSLFVTQKTEIFTLIFYKNRYFRIFDFSKLKNSPFGHFSGYRAEIGDLSR